MRSISFYCFLFITWSIHTSVYAQIDSVRKYYSLRNAAELHIADSNFTTALHEYKEAFSVKQPHSRDLYNAYIVSLILKDSIYANRIFEELIVNGMENETIEQLPFFKNYKYRGLYKWVTRGYDSLIAIAKVSPKRKYAAVMDSIKELDQSVRARKMDTTEIKIMTAQDYRNIDFLYSYILDVGFPSYQQTGLFEDNYHGLPYAFNTYMLLMWHTTHISKKLNGLSLKAVYDGYMEPEEYAFIIDVQNKESYYYEVLDKELKNGAATSVNIKEINKRRATIYLDPVEDFIKKIRFQRSAAKSDFALVPLWVLANNSIDFDIRSWEAE